MASSTPIDSGGDCGCVRGSQFLGAEGGDLRPPQQHSTRLGQLHLRGSEGWWEAAPGGRLAGPERICPVSSFQDGGHRHPPGLAPAWGLPHPAGSEGCVPHSGDEGQRSSFPSFQLAGSSVRVPVTPIRPVVSPLDIHQLLHPVVATLRQFGIRVIIYLDDLLILAHSLLAAREATASVVHLLCSLGFVINFSKSCLVPSQEITFLGFLVCSTTMTIQISQDPRDKLLRTCRQLLQADRTTVREVASVVGMMQSAWPGVLPAPLHLRGLQDLKNSARHAALAWESALILNSASKEDLRWWVRFLDSWNGRPVKVECPVLTIASDASSQGGGGGWGAVCGTQTTGGRWSAAESRLHINALELLAGTFAVQCFARHVQKGLVLLQMDNQCAVAYVNRMGGTRSQRLNSLAADLWHWCLARQITIRAEYIPGALNVIADFWSRNHSSSEWHLLPQAFALLKTRYGGCHVDLFATRINTQLPDFVSWHPDPQAVATDAFSQPWQEMDGYAFPPFCLIDGVGGADVATTRQVPVDGSSRQSSPIDGQCPPPLGRVAHLRHSYSMSGFSAAVSDLLVASWRTNTSRHYDSAWALWSRWCAQRSIDPLRPALTRVLEFLSDQFQDGRAFRTISGYRSALSTMLPPVDGTSVGSHPTVVRLLRGAYNLRPPAPRYTFTWDVQLVLDFLRSWPDVSVLSDKQLTLRLAMLLALSGAYRCGELCLLSSVFSQLSDGSVRLPLLGTRKTQRVGEPLQTVQVCPFSVAALCPVQHLLEYGRRSAVWRLDGSGPLLLSFRKPHKPVSSPTVARWLKEVLGLAGIDTAQFSAHSSRGAATSAAARAGVSTAVILAAADWKRATTFRRFYCRDVTPPADCFSAAVLRSATA
ncbi:uncharacterized protein LOC135810554 [Sycon ciliatum]|uniref:uncharacterized protein LOC135810554 n=1 Tax=Sycon ciliatum TaxID=27933 RepID=UPI0031F67E03